MKSKILTILLSLAIAFGLWLYVITYEYTQIEYTFNNLEVQILGESTLSDRGLILASGSDYTVDLTISGKRSDIIKLRSSDISVTVNLSNIYEAGEKNLSYDVTFPGDLGNGAVEIVKRSPDSVKVTVADKIEKDIPVEVEILGEPAPGYLIDQEAVKISHTMVNVSGPKEWMDKVQKGKVTVNMDGAKETYEDVLKLVLCDSEGERIEGDMEAVTVATSMIQVQVPVLMTKEIQLQLTIIPGGGLTVDDVEFSMTADKITVTGSPSVISKLSDSIEIDRIELKDQTESITAKGYTIPLPADVVVVGNPSRIVFVTLKIPEMTEIELKIPQENIQVMGVPSGYEAAVYGDDLTLKLRVKKAYAGSVKVSDVHVSVNVDGATTGGFYSVQVEVKGSSGIGIVDIQEEVYIALTPKGNANGSTGADS